MTDELRQPDVEIVAVPHEGGPEGSGQDWRGLQQEFMSDENAFVRELELLMARLRKERRRRGLTQKVIAERMNVSQSRVSDIETGNVETTEPRTLGRYISAVGFQIKLKLTSD